MSAAPGTVRGAEPASQADHRGQGATGVGASGCGFGGAGARRLDDAIRYLRQATLHYPDSPTVHYRLSRLYSLTGQPDLARQESAVFSRLKGYQDVRRGPE